MLGSSLGIAYLVVTPPFHFPDELRHLRRSVQIARLGIVAGARIPESIDELGRTAKLAMAQRRRRDTAYSVTTLRSLSAIPLDRERTVEFPGDRTRVYSPVVYLPAALAAAAGIQADARPLAILYLCRLGLLAAGLALLHAAIRLTPRLAWPMCLIALLPMATFIRSGISADTLTTGFAFLLFALLLRAREGTHPIGIHDALPMALVGAALSLCKVGYLPLVLAPLALPAERFTSPRSRGRVLMLAAGVPVVVQLLWLSALGDWVATDNPPGASPDAQLRLMLESPGRFVAALQATWVSPERVWRLADGVVGRLLMLTVRPPAVLVVGCVGLLLLLVCGDRLVRTPRPAERLVLLATAAASLLLMSVGAYLQWTPVGGGLVYGIQGRYLHPILPVVLLALVPPPGLRWRCSDELAGTLVGTGAILANAWGIGAIVAATWAATR